MATDAAMKDAHQSRSSERAATRQETKATAASTSSSSRSSRRAAKGEQEPSGGSASRTRTRRSVSSQRGDAASASNQQDSSAKSKNRGRNKAHSSKHGRQQADLDDPKFVRSLKKEMNEKTEALPREIRRRFGEIVWVKLSGYPFWPGLIMDPRKLPPSMQLVALKGVGSKFWMYFYGTHDFASVSYKNVVPWDDATYPYREGYPQRDLKASARKEQLATAMDEADSEEFLPLMERIDWLVKDDPLAVPPPKKKMKKDNKTAAKPAAAANVATTSTTEAKAKGSAGDSRNKAPLRAPAAKQESTGVGTPRKSPVAATSKRQQKQQAVVTAAESTNAPPRARSPPAQRQRQQKKQIVTATIAAVKAVAPPVKVSAPSARAATPPPQSTSQPKARAASIPATVQATIPRSATPPSKPMPVVKTDALTPANVPPSKVAGIGTQGRNNKRALSASTPPAAASAQAPTAAAAVSGHQASLDKVQYTVGPLAAFSDKLHELYVQASATGNWSSMAVLSQLFNEKVLYRSDLERSGLANTIAEIRKSPNQHVVQTAKTIRVHLMYILKDDVATEQDTAAARPPKRRKSDSGEATSSDHAPSAPGTPSQDAPGNSANNAGGLSVKLTRKGNSHTAAPKATPPPQQQRQLQPPAPAPAAPAADSTLDDGIDYALSLIQKVRARAKSRPTKPESESSDPSPRSQQQQQQHLEPSIYNTNNLPRRRNPALVIFNKDGTLIDFDSMWGGWVESQAWKLEASAKLPIRDAFYGAMGYDWTRRSITRFGALSTLPKRELAKVAVDMLVANGVALAAAQTAVRDCWSYPDPVMACRPLADIADIFRTIKQLGIKIAICTTDNRERTEKTLAHLGLTELVDDMVCGDDGLPAAPAPEQVWTLCTRLGVGAFNTVVVGDSASDMALGHNAACSLSVGVFGGAAALDDLSKEADVLISSLDKITRVLFQYGQQASQQ